MKAIESTEKPEPCAVYVGGYHPAGERCECFWGGKGPIIGFPTQRHPESGDDAVH